MKGIVFIGWSNTKELAVEVKKKLYAKGYIGVVGGDYEENPSGLRRRDRTVSETVCFQMDKCDQAIMLFGKPNNSEAISGNLLYETGYFSSRFDSEQLFKKVHIFKIGFLKTDKKNMFPSDLDGVWESAYSPEGQSNDELATSIVNEFLRCQKLSNEENKMAIVSNYHKIEYELDCHFNKPLISDYELAKRLLTYVQATYIFQDYNAAKIKCNKLRNYIRDNSIQTFELSNVLDYSVCSFELFSLAAPSVEGDGRVHIEGKTFRRLLNKFCRIAAAAYYEEKREEYDSFKLEQIEFDEYDLFNDDFKVSFISQIQEHITFLFLVYLDNPQLNEQEQIKQAKAALSFGEVAIHNLLLLSRFNSANTEYSKLLLGYAYRNFYTFNQILQNEKNSVEYKKKAFSMRKELYEEYIDDSNINPILKNYLALEYFIQLADMMDTMEDRDDILDNLDDIKCFIEKTDLYEKTRNLSFQRLKEAFDNLNSTYMNFLH